MKVATVQFQHVAGDITANLAVVKNYVLKAATKNVELVIFPECCLSGYWHLRNLTREQLGKLVKTFPLDLPVRKLRSSPELTILQLVWDWLNKRPREHFTTLFL